MTLAGAERSSRPLPRAPMPTSARPAPARLDAARSDPARRLLMLTHGGWSHASSRIRAAQYAPLLDPPYTVRWLPARPDGGGAVRRAASKRAATLRRALALAAGRADVVFAQRLALPPGQLARLRAPLVYDFDDALYLDAPGPTAAMVRAATRVVVSTPELVPFCEAQGATPAVIPSPVDTDRVTPRRSGDASGDASGEARRDAPFTVGWMGSPWTAPYLDAVAGALAEVARQRPVRLLLVGAGDAPAVPGVDVERVPWAFSAEPGVLRRMSVGIMPLPDEPWTRAKGGYKLLAYMAAGLPTVASPVGVNREIVEPGRTGFHAETPQEWVQALVRLHDDPALCAAMGRAGRERAVARYSRTVCAAALARVLAEAVEAGHAAAAR